MIFSSRHCGFIKNCSGKFPTAEQLCWSLFSVNLKTMGLQLYFKETPAEELFSEFWEIFKSKFFTDVFIQATAYVFSPN